MNRRSYKLVTIITKEMVDANGATLQKAGLAVRVPRPLARIQVDNGYASYTSKGKFKQMLIKQKKAERAEQIRLEERRRLEGIVRGHRRKPLRG